MAKKRGGGGKSAARSAAAKKGWETRRKGGGAAKGSGKTRPTTSSKPRTVSGPRGGKVGTRAEQQRAAQLQAARRARFSGKAPVSSGRAAYKEALSRARLEKSLGYKGAFGEVKAMQRKRAATPGVGGKKSPAGGRKSGSTSQRKRSASAQADRTKRFSSKAPVSLAKRTYKEAKSAARTVRRMEATRGRSTTRRKR